MGSPSLSGKVLPLAGLLGAALLIVGTAGCDRPSPVAVEPDDGLVSYSHIDWTGCNAWDGPAFANATFAKGSAELDDDDRAALDANVVRLNLCPEDGFHVQGLAPNGRRAKELAAARAQVVADYYLQAGAELFPGRMEVRSYVMGGGCAGRRWESCDRFNVTMTLPF